jgi:hypothetical protein
MHHVSRFCSPGLHPHAVNPSILIGVRQLAVQRIGDCASSATHRGTQPRDSGTGWQQAKRDGAESAPSGQLVGNWDANARDLGKAKGRRSLSLQQTKNGWPAAANWVIFSAMVDLLRTRCEIVESGETGAGACESVKLTRGS